MLSISTKSDHIYSYEIRSLFNCLKKFVIILACDLRYAKHTDKGLISHVWSNVIFIFKIYVA